jgi:hypothetical protein
VQIENKQHKMFLDLGLQNIEKTYSFQAILYYDYTIVLHYLHMHIVNSYFIKGVFFQIKRYIAKANNYIHDSNGNSKIFE